VLLKYFRDERTYSVLFVELLLTAISSGHIARRAQLKSGRLGLFAVAAIIVSVAAVTLFLTLFILLNDRGA
jgi:hypothetical protein